MWRQPTAFVRRTARPCCVWTTSPACSLRNAVALANQPLRQRCFSARDAGFRQRGDKRASVLSVTHVDGLRIDGCGASIVVTTPSLASSRSTAAARVSNLTLDYDPPITQGRVLAVQSPLRYSRGSTPASRRSVRRTSRGRAASGAAMSHRQGPSAAPRHKQGTLNCSSSQGGPHVATASSM